VVGLLQGAYRSSTASDRWEFLLPAVRMFKATMQWEDAGEPSGSAGTLNWVTEKFRHGARFALMAAALYPDFATDTTLTTQNDPAGGGKYVSTALLDRMKDWVATYGEDQGTALAYAVGDVFPCVSHDTKFTGMLGNPYANAATFYRNVWPLLTTGAMHTDRIFLSPSKVLRELQVAWTGDAPTEGLPMRPLVRWIGDSMDMAVSCNRRDLAGTQWSAFVHDFADEPQLVTLILEEGLPPAEYVLEVGDASESCDVFPGAVSTSLPVIKRGTMASVTFEITPGLNLVRLTRTGTAIAAADWDLAVDPPRLVAEPLGGYTASVRVVNIGSASAPSSDLELYVAAVNPDGSMATPAALPGEFKLSTVNVSLGGINGWTLPETTKSFTIPVGSPVGELLDQGYGLQLRAVVPYTPGEGDVLNNAQLRCWFLGEIPDAP